MKTGLWGGLMGNEFRLVNGKCVDFMVDNGKITTTSKGKTSRLGVCSLST